MALSTIAGKNDSVRMLLARLLTKIQLDLGGDAVNDLKANDTPRQIKQKILNALAGI